MNPLLERISVAPDVCHGKACVRGTRVLVSVLLDNLAESVPPEEILDAYPQLTEEDLRAVLAYAAELARERHVRLPVGAPS